MKKFNRKLTQEEILKNALADFENAKAELSKIASNYGSPLKVKQTKKKRKPISDEARANMSKSQKKRHAAKKKVVKKKAAKDDIKSLKEG